ncbi:hypothetical protein ACL02S_09670 [Nocardia sp. 004]|uniref:hypothetical protein n=1 Tax=Nocardia sp. 004 TaxID=3385978 RepID=UPI00399FA908
MDLHQQLGTAHTEHDATVAGMFASPQLRRLIHTAIGLSDDSIDLLTTMSGRLRAAAGMTVRDPLDDY